MGSSADDLLSTPGDSRKAMVGNQKANEQGLPRTTKQLRGLNWTEILNKHGLESPGYQETVAKMRSRTLNSKGK